MNALPTEDLEVKHGDETTNKLGLQSEKFSGGNHFWVGLIKSFERQ